MIIACPACATRYVVPDSAIGVDGRTVRCAKCRHSWFQAGPEIAIPADRAEPRPAPPAPVPQREPAPSAMPRPDADRPDQPQADAFRTAGSAVAERPVAPPPVPDYPVAASPAASAPTPDPIPPRVYDDDDSLGYGASTFAHEPPFRPRRNWLKIYTLGAAAFAVVACAGIAAVAWYGLPDWAPLARQSFADAQPDLTLDFPPNRMDRRTLPNGTKFFGISGKVTNVGKERRTVPSIRFVLQDKQGLTVYQFDIAPPKRQLAPGESVTINEARTDVPATAVAVLYGWTPG